MADRNSVNLLLEPNAELTPPTLKACSVLILRVSTPPLPSNRWMSFSDSRSLIITHRRVLIILPMARSLPHRSTSRSPDMTGYLTCIPPTHYLTTILPSWRLLTAPGTFHHIPMVPITTYPRPHTHHTLAHLWHPMKAYPLLQ